MARIQILELPTEHHGDDMVTPFAVIVDQVQNVETVRQAIANSDIRQSLGARAVLAFDETVDIPANQVALEDGQAVHLKVEPDLTGFEESVSNAIVGAQQLVDASLNHVRQQYGNRAPAPYSDGGTLPATEDD